MTCPAATRKVAIAKATGALVMPDRCEVCDVRTPKLVGHHAYGYDRPLDVWWVCSPCNALLPHDGSLTREEALEFVGGSPSGRDWGMFGCALDRWLHDRNRGYAQLAYIITGDYERVWGHEYGWRYLDEPTDDLRRAMALVGMPWPTDGRARGPVYRPGAKVIARLRLGDTRCVVTSVRPDKTCGFRYEVVGTVYDDGRRSDRKFAHVGRRLFFRIGMAKMHLMPWWPFVDGFEAIPSADMQRSRMWSSMPDRRAAMIERLVTCRDKVSS